MAVCWQLAWEKFRPEKALWRQGFPVLSHSGQCVDTASEFQGRSAFSWAEAHLVSAWAAFPSCLNCCLSKIHFEWSEIRFILRKIKAPNTAVKTLGLLAVAVVRPACYYHYGAWLYDDARPFSCLTSFFCGITDSCDKCLLLFLTHANASHMFAGEVEFPW